MSRPWAGATSMLVVLVLILGGLAALPVGATAPTGEMAAAQDASSRIVSAAAAALNEGAGPAHGATAGCTVSSSGQATCGLRGPHGAAPPSASPRWFDVAGNISTHSRGATPAVEFSGLMAYDPLLSEVVLFDGCSPGACPGTQTWVYNGSSWSNRTASLTSFPPARQGSGMDFDPLLRGVVLFAGEDLSDNAESDTWLFTNAGWSNITSTVGIPVDSGGAKVTWAWGAMAWDPALHGLVAVDGCRIGDCRNISNVWDQTWVLGAGGWAYHGPGPGTVANATHLEFSSLAYDATDGYLVSFGGFDSHPNATSNATFTMDSSGVWVNITGRDAGCIASVCTTPPARESAAMTWDAPLGAIFLTDGYSSSSKTWLNDSWLFLGGAWFPSTAISPSSPSGYCPVAGSALPKVSDNIAPFIIGGFGSISACYSNEWVYEIPPATTVTIAPDPLDQGMTATFNASWVVGSGTGIRVGWTAFPGDGHPSTVRIATGHNTSTPFSVRITHAYATSGSFVASVTESDFYFVPATSPTGIVTVYPALTASITASPTSIPPGGSVTFMAVPVGGSGTYSYAWAFGDGVASTAQDPPAHTYSKAGTYAVNLTVTDGVNRSVNSSVTIAVETTGFFQGAGLYLVIGIVIAVGVIIGLVAWTWRRRRPTASLSTERVGSPTPTGLGTPASGADGGLAPGPSP
ncbi:MAG: PKD domain-containing protein [Thermoplasmata archaeon]|nr:PKD domain-containing protein [Thermoplasmata archaeon]